MKSHKDWHDRGYLPHFDVGAVVQSITFRLADSVPRELIEELDATEDRDRRLRLEAIVDDGRGNCLLRDPANADIVRRALKHFDGERYKLIAWVKSPMAVQSFNARPHPTSCGRDARAPRKKSRVET